MGRPLRIRVRREGTGAGYLEALLRLHGFLVDDDEDGSTPDAVLVAADAPPSRLAADAPLILVPSWQPDASEAADLVAGGADDVLPMAELNAGRLEAAVRKALVRRARAPRPEPAWAMWSAPAGLALA